MTTPESNSYLDRLNYNPNFENGFISNYLKNFRIVILLFVIICIAGIFSYINLPQRLNPEINIPIVSVSAALPGASPNDVETLLTIPMEDAINSIPEVDILTSTSQENLSLITVQFINGVDPKEAEQKVQSEINKVANLPDDATDPLVKAFDFEDQPVWTFTLTSDGETPSLMRFAEKMKTDIDALSKVDRVETSGFEEQEIQVIIDPSIANSYGVSPAMLAGLVKTATSSFPSGNLDTGKNILSLAIDPQITNINDLRNIRVNVNGTILKLGDIAEISERSKDNQTQSFYATNNDPAKRIVTFNVFKTQGSDINQTADEIKTVVDQKIKEGDGHYKVTTISNSSEDIRTQFTDLLGEFRTTIFLVFLCLLIFVGFRQAVISSITIPLTFLSAFALMPLVNMSMNFLTMFAFLLSLGLLIDDTIVVVSAMTTYFKSGKFTPHQTGVLVWKDFIVPIWSTTITTIFAFIPLLLATGIIGEFIKPLPIVIAITMISSTAIAIFIALPLMIFFLKPSVPHRVNIFLKILFVVATCAFLIFLLPKTVYLVPVIIVYLILLFTVFKLRKPLLQSWSDFVERNRFVKTILNKGRYYIDNPIINLDPIAEGYKRIISKILDSKKARTQVIIAVICFALISYALVPLGLVKNEFFPKSDGELLFVNIEFPSGTNIDQITAETETFLEDLRHTEYVDFVTANVGRGSGFDTAPMGGNVSGFTLHLPKLKERPITSIDLAEQLRAKYKNYNKGKLTVNELNAGPPAGADIQIQLQGDDLGVLDSYADQIVDYLSKQNGINNISKSIKPGSSKIVFVPDEDRLSQNNINTNTLGLWLRSFASGFTLDSFNFGGNSTEEKDIVFKLGKGSKYTTDLSTVTIPTENGELPLLSLGHLETNSSPTLITREDQKRTISIQAGVITTQANIADEGAKLQKYAESLNVPSGYMWKTGGVNEENEKSVNSIIKAMGLAAILIMATMILQFGSFRQAFIALAVIPLAISSVFFLFALTGTALTFPALIGVLALFGIVVTNSMFVIDKINLNRREGMPFKESIADAGSSRLEPIVLTKLSTVLGLLPITLADPTWRGLGGAIISGVLLASSIMLFFIPVVYYNFFAKSEGQTDQN